MEAEECYRTFTDTKQEPLRLRAALEGFFLEETAEDQRKAYGVYLKKRIRPAMEVLILEDDTEKMEQLEALGWLKEIPAETFLRIARREKKQAALVWLLNLKKKKGEYRDRDFEL